MWFDLGSRKFKAHPGIENGRPKRAVPPGELTRWFESMRCRVPLAKGFESIDTQAISPNVALRFLPTPVWSRLDANMGETFLGGFAGGFLEKGFHVGYGLYFTTARLIGIDLGSHGGGALGGTLAGFIKGELMPNLSPEESAKVIEDLDRMKEFDIGKDQIRLIKLKKPGLGVGHMTITPNHGDSITIKLRHRTAYDRLVQLTQAFSPEAVRA